MPQQRRNRKRPLPKSTRQGLAHCAQQGGFTGLMFLRYLPRPAALPRSPDALPGAPPAVKRLAAKPLTKLSITDAIIARD
jgi:hypothetical protein